MVELFVYFIYYIYCCCKNIEKRSTEAPFNNKTVPTTFKTATMSVLFVVIVDGSGGGGCVAVELRCYVGLH